MTSQDPVLDISQQHHHEHSNHGGAAAGHTQGEKTYAQGNLPEDHQIPPQFPHSHSKDIESGVLTEEKHGLPSAGTVERGSGSGTSVRSNGSKRSAYQKYKVFIHAFIFCLFTG